MVVRSQHTGCDRHNVPGFTFMCILLYKWFYLRSLCMLLVLIGLGTRVGLPVCRNEVLATNLVRFMYSMHSIYMLIAIYHTLTSAHACKYNLNTSNIKVQ